MTSDYRRRSSSRSLLDQMELIAEEQSSSIQPHDSTEVDPDEDTDEGEDVTDIFDTEHLESETMDDSLQEIFETVLENELDKELAIDMEYEPTIPKRLSDSAPALGTSFTRSSSYVRDRRASRQSIQAFDYGGALPRTGHASSDDSLRRHSVKVSPQRVTGAPPSYHISPGDVGGALGDSKSLIDRVRKGTFLGLLNQSRRNFHSNGNNSSNLVIQAIHKLNSAGENDTAAAVSAAAAVVAASAQQRGFVQFGQGDFVLVMLTMLEMADFDGDRELYTIDPVNALGYPKGEGKSESQKQGPYLYVLCKVMQVHFDEDERYYTVRRCDTGAEQRADPGFMERIRDENAIEAAFQAAKRSQRAMHDHVGPDRVEKTFLQRMTYNCGACWMSMLQRVVPFYISTRNAAKVQVKAILHGDGRYGVSCHFSGVNFLVLCSFIFLFEDVFALAFLPSATDQSATTLGLVVWIILVLELIFQVLIRPPDYHDILHTEKAFLPSTARHINSFHLTYEALALILFFPHVICTLSSKCLDGPFLNRTKAPLLALTSASTLEAALGRLDLSLTILRAFGLIRHWKQMWIRSAFEAGKKDEGFIRKLFFSGHPKTMQRFRRRKKDVSSGEEFYAASKNVRIQDDYAFSREDEDEEEQRGQIDKIASNPSDVLLKNAASIGTALMLVNSHRALSLLLVIACVFPLLLTLSTRNTSTTTQSEFLQAINIQADSVTDCDFLESAVDSWLVQADAESGGSNNNEFTHTVLWARVLPVRCPWQDAYGVITSQAECPISAGDLSFSRLIQCFASATKVRVDEFTHVSLEKMLSVDFGDQAQEQFSVDVIFDNSRIVAIAHFSLFLMLTSFVLTALVGLSVMRSDAERLVLFPLQRMLMIVVRYAENPLSTPASQLDRASADPSEELGNYETEQLINAIAKIADLLRKCWGVAGADIISSNLARTKDGTTVVFNPTIPGKQVYALFGFVGINDFSKQLRMLEKDVMILINDVARVVHDEVFRWGHSNSGQCNKNLGSSFLMVFRIGNFEEVHDKKKRATDVVFSSQVKNLKVRRLNAAGSKRRTSFDIGNNGTLQLASLPGIQAFADRALLGFLKSFAGLHRDLNMQNWQKDFRLGAGVSRYKIDVLYGMDAGWAVEGAVGSEYKIDATYLSPHVNMASRMMSACKQYGVKVMLSQAVEELLSKQARSKLRHLDTVYVKGSIVEQRIYTYDARHDGVDFFLFERSPEQADQDADAYTPAIWDTDQDLKSMRQHVTDEFVETFHSGVELYIQGNWKEAVVKIQRADDLMYEEVVEQGFVEYMNEDMGEYGRVTQTSREEIERIKEEYGDGASKCLVQFMLKRDCVPPPDWNGVRQLMSK